MIDWPLTSYGKDQASNATNMLELVDLARIEVSTRIATDSQERSRLGQYFTPVEVGRFMSSLFETPTQDVVHLLDAGGGNGMLTASLVSELCAREQTPPKIEATLWEIDPSLHKEIDTTLALCHSLAEEHGVEFSCQVVFGDFIEDAVNRIVGGDLFDHDERAFDLAILNPPYRKLASNTRERDLLHSAGIETSNLYSAFVWLAMELLGDQGQLVAITPRSYMNGTYFRPFRKRLAELMRFRRVHIYESRNKAFAGDDVLQENTIIHAMKGGAPAPVEISVSNSPDDTGMAFRSISPDELIFPDDPDAVIHVVPDEIDAHIGRIMRGMPNTLADMEVSVSTGRVVDFRVKDRLRTEAEKGDVPLIYPRHLANGFIDWPQAKNGKPNAISPAGPDDPLLLPSGWYVLVKRLSAKEEPRRIVATLCDPSCVSTDRIAFDNKLNVLHDRNTGLPREFAIGLAMYLNSSIVDAYFRQFSGHTQVNAGDLRAIRFPAREQLLRIGARCSGSMPSETEINEILRQEIDEMGKDNDPIASKQNVSDAIEILKAIDAPRLQQNERSALTLLGLLDVKAKIPWANASAPLRGVTELMLWMESAYGKKYKPNTRETIRRQTLHQFIEMGLVALNPDKPGRPPNSPNNVYQIDPSALALIKKYGSKGWGKSLSTYLKSMEGKNRLLDRARDLERIPVTLPDDRCIELSAGGQNILIKTLIEEFAPRFTPGGKVIYVGDAGEKHLLNETEYMAGLGLQIDPHGKMPDVIIHDLKRDWLILIEAVTSHGPVNLLRHNQLKDLFESSTAGLVFVTAFIDRQAMRQYLPEIAWETEVWVADAPDHLIHFNGERFLGPYEKAT